MIQTIILTFLCFSLLGQEPSEIEKDCIPRTTFEPSCYKYPAGYNAPAAVNLSKSWAGFLGCSFLYWGVDEDGLTFAQSATLSQGNLIMSEDSKFLECPFNYHPGFKLTMGAIYGIEWNVHATYTNLTGSSSIKKTAPTSSAPGIDVWNLSDWFQQTITFGNVNSPQAQSLSATKISTKWDIELNILDLNVERPSYLGRNLIISPLVGIRGVWIGQEVKVFAFQPASSVGGAVYLGPQPIVSTNESCTFSIGPQVGCAASYLLPMGWRIDAQGAGSLLATNSTKLKHKETAQSIAVPPGPYVINHPHYHGVLPSAEVRMGFGWGSYVGNHNYYVDLSASYDCTIFCGQNVIRQMLDEAWAGTRAAAGNLSFHGVTVNTQFYF